MIERESAGEGTILIFQLGVFELSVFELSKNLLFLVLYGRELVLLGGARALSFGLLGSNLLQLVQELLVSAIARGVLTGTGAVDLGSDVVELFLSGLMLLLGFGEVSLVLGFVGLLRAG